MKLKQKKAFTVMELLIAVAVVVILLAISMPLVAGWSTDLKMTELDNYAKTIFLEAQNQMIAKKAEGGLSDFYAEMETTYALRQLDEAPQDFNVVENGDKWMSIYYLENDDSIITDVIPEGSAFEGSYLIELNPETGDIYGVFYWEDSVAIDYENNIQTLVNRNIEGRKQQKIGYYGGELDNTASEGFMLGQEVSVINNEELYVKISYDLSSRLLRYYDEALDVKMVITGKGSGAEWEYPVSTAAMVVNADKMELYVLLDSMIPGYSFDEITGGRFTPGEDLGIKVTSTFERGSYYQVETKDVETNSLFLLKLGNEISIGAVRHLRNLDKDYYTHVGESAIITQANDIDFDSSNYAWALNGENCSYVKVGARPISVMEPIENSTVFMKNGSKFAGNNNLLKNFVIDTNEDYVGIFKQISGMVIEKVKIQDIKLNAGNGAYVGAFAGKITGSTVKDCGVYLSIRDKENAYYSNNVYAEGIYANEMDSRYDTLIVSGGQYVGGFCGFASNVNISNSFAAVKVKGTYDVGGFCGFVENGTSITNCYASGEMTAISRAGGLVGNAGNTTFNNCYSTGNISSSDATGGFVGVSANSSYIGCRAYGKLTNTTGSSILANSGAFLGTANSTDDVFADCSYLEQDGYNVGLVDVAEINSKYYDELESATPNDASNSFPYDALLVRTAFPFTMVTGSHYGNWPTKYFIDTSIVYYEVYEDNTYGYYCVTTISEVGGTGSSNLTWVLDTLKDEICVEDGYALLTLYNLESFKYDLHIGSVIPGDENYNANKIENQTVTISDEHGTGKAKLLRQQSALVFNGYEGEFNSETNFDAEEIKSSFSVTGMYLYQLPYTLQTTNRVGVSNFYDRLIIYNGKAQNNPTPVIGGESVDDTALTFYYCPHFSKNAVNPGIWDGTAKLANPVHVYVRSARQLNALGRYTYYWNTNAGYVDRILFEQETDISFSAYVKTYCGQTFNLMDTSASNPVRNKPIGRHKNEEKRPSPGQFNNSYNGNYKKIIDYRLETDLQFAGFFGEVEDGIIENIILTVSEPYDPANPDSGGGYIHCTYDANNSTAIGALAGLSYNTKNEIRNCSASGYEVKYTGVENPIVKSISVGGLVGVSMGVIENCSATCDVRVELNGKYEYAISMGGLAGTAYYMITRNSYAGGTIDIAISDDNNIQYIADLAAGGIAGAVLKIYSEVGDEGKDSTRFENLYSYTRILVDSKFDNRLGTGQGVKGKFVISPIVGKEILTAIKYHRDNGWNITVDEMSIVNCKYLDTVFNGVLDEGEVEVETPITNTYGATAVTYEELENLSFSGMGSVNDMYHTFPISDALRGKIYNFPAAVKDADGEYVHYGDWPYAIATKVLSKVYPGYYECYEDGTVGFYYVDINGDTINKLDNSVDIIEAGYGTLKLHPIESEEPVGTVSISGVTYYLYEDSSISNPSNKINVPYEMTYDRVIIADGVEEGDSDADITRTLYINPNFGAAISTDSDLGYVESNPLQIRTLEQLTNISDISCAWWGEAAYMKQTRDLELDTLTESVRLQYNHVYDGGRNEGFKMIDAACIVFADNGGTIHDVLSIGNKDVFINHSWGTVDKCLIEGADIYLENEYRNEAMFAHSNQGTIKNSFVKNSKITSTNMNAAGFVWSNYTSGVIENCGAYSEVGYTGITVNSNQAFGFVQSNDGTIKNCFATGTMNGANIASGFIDVNLGLIENCYANCNNITETGNAYGFIERNWETGTIRSCYSAGLVKTSATSSLNKAYGFGCNERESATIEYCYSICKLEPGNAEAYGFSNGDIGTVTDCYWGYSNDQNADETIIGAGTKKTLSALSQLTSGNITGYIFDNAAASPYDATLGEVYPYPAINGLVHYGDWPKPAGVRNNLIKDSSDYVGVFYYENYEDGTYGVYALGYQQCYIANLHIYEEGANEGYVKDYNAPVEVINTLGATDETVISSGYGVFYADGATSGKWNTKATIINGNGSAITDAGEAISIPIEGYEFRKINADDDSFSRTLIYIVLRDDSETPQKVKKVNIAINRSSASRPEQ